MVGFFISGVFVGFAIGFVMCVFLCRVAEKEGFVKGKEAAADGLAEYTAGINAIWTRKADADKKRIADLLDMITKAREALS
jgi:hypothetical protein